MSVARARCWQCNQLVAGVQRVERGRRPEMVFTRHRAHIRTRYRRTKNWVTCPASGTRISEADWEHPDEDLSP